MEIKNIKKEIIFRTDKDNIKDAIEDAVKIGANLRGADLRGANLRAANFRGAENIPFVPIACPSDGEFTGWKSAINY